MVVCCTGWSMVWTWHGWCLLFFCFRFFFDSIVLLRCVGRLVVIITQSFIFCLTAQVAGCRRSKHANCVKRRHRFIHSVNWWDGIREDLLQMRCFWQLFFLSKSTLFYAFTTTFQQQICFNKFQYSRQEVNCCIHHSLSSTESCEDTHGGKDRETGE
mgnify:CR=1 FL=1